MILDSMKTRGFYAFFNRMKFSGTLGLYLVALFMCLGFEVKAVELPSYAICHNGWQNVDETIELKPVSGSSDRAIFEIKSSQPIANFGIELYDSQGNLIKEVNAEGKNAPTINVGHITGIAGDNVQVFVYIKGSNGQLYIQQFIYNSYDYYNGGTDYNAAINAMIASAAIVGSGGGENPVPTISNVPTPNAQCASNQINIQTPSVDYHGSNANGSCWQYKNNNNQWEDISSSTRLSVGTYSVRYIVAMGKQRLVMRRL